MEEKNKITAHQIIWYLLIFSVIGLIIETLYCFITTGIFESRKGLILGPVCPIYGVGAVAIIIGLSRFKGSKLRILTYGAIGGSVVEYVISFVLEALYGTRFWDYSYMTYHLNGRICIIYSIFWAILSLLMIEYVKPILTKRINKFKLKWLDIVIVVVFTLDVLLTVWGVRVYIERVTIGRKSSSEAVFFATSKYQFEETCFSNEIMSNIFPNMRTIDKNGNEIWVKDIIK